MPVLKRGELGVVYTPASVVAPMVRKVLAPLLADPSKLRICDFSVGEGAFVVEVIAQLAEALERVGVSDARRIAAGCVYGADIDARAIEIARERTGCPNLVVADALTHEWGQFDIVVGNPPYVRQEQLEAKHVGWQTATGVADLYVYFFELAHRLLRPGGRYCLITPNKWLTVEYGRALRGYLSNQRSVEGVVDVARLPVFADADAFPCITWGTLGGNHVPRGHRARGGDVETALAAGGVEIALGGDPWHIDDPAARALIERLEARWPSLGDVLPEKPARGVVTGCNRAFVVDAAIKARLDDELVRPFLKGRDIRRWRCPAPERFVLLVDRGTDLEPHVSVGAHLSQFRDELQPKPVDHRGDPRWAGRKPGNYQWWELQDPVGALAASDQPRLVYQDIQTGPACALIPGGVVPDTTVWILPSSDRYLLAVLNSSLYGWYAQQRFPPALNGSVRPKLAYMRRLPIATPSATAHAAIERLVEDRLYRDDPELDRAIDQAVLDAYQLTGDERTLLRQG